VDGSSIYCSGRALQIERAGDQFAAKDIWKGDTPHQYNTPVLKDGLLIGLSDSDVLFCVKADSGETAWTASLGDGAAAQEQRPQGGERPRGRRGRGPRPGYGSIVDAGSVLLALTPKSRLVVFEPNATEFKQVASYQVAEGQTYAYPIVSGNHLFVKDQQSVAQLAIE
jgi:outer membrane protein assembly factor BamB